MVPLEWSPFFCFRVTETEGVGRGRGNRRIRFICLLWTPLDAVSAEEKRIVEEVC